MITYNPRDPHDMAAAQRGYDEIAEDHEPIMVTGRCECGATTICGQCPNCDIDEFHGE